MTNRECELQRLIHIVFTTNMSPGYDCGVFVCRYADFIANDHPLVFRQEHMNAAREKIAVEILKTSKRLKFGGLVVLEENN